jgi:hypothetical protein
MSPFVQLQLDVTTFNFKKLIVVVLEFQLRPPENVSPFVKLGLDVTTMNKRQVVRKWPSRFPVQGSRLISNLS